MKLKTIACTAAFLLTPALASAAPAHDHGATGQSQSQSQPPQAEAAKPQEMKCPMMQGMHGGMKMDGQTMPHGQGGAQHQATGNGAESMKGMHGMKCMQGDAAAAAPAPAPAPEGQHNHDHSGAGKPQ